MKKILSYLSFGMLMMNAPALAQLNPGATAPNFTFTDTKGNSHTLYDYLNAGKIVAIDVFATWCGPCYMYHQTHVHNDLYKKYDEPGAKTWKVFMFEGDDQTDAADLAGTGSNTVGDWESGVDCPIIDPSAGTALSNFTTGYDIQFFPTLYLIGPNKKTYEMVTESGGTSLPSLANWENAAKKYFGYAVGIDEFSDDNPVTIFPNPAKGFTNVYFRLNNSSNVKLTVANLMGQVVAIKDFGTLLAGDQQLNYDISNLSAGVYYFTISAENSRSLMKRVVVQ
jgi:thiol-disulfide isomerase/thioredoxin